MAVIERLWDDSAFEAEHRRRSLAEAKRWDGNKLAEQYEKDTQGVAAGWIVAGPSGRRTHTARAYRGSRSEGLSFRQPGHRRIGGDRNRAELET